VLTGVGGVIPVAVLSSSVVLAANPQQIGTLQGLYVQGSNLGQFAGIPLIAGVVAASGQWQSALMVTAPARAVRNRARTAGSPVRKIGGRFETAVAMPLRALYVDFNSYFASVEQQLVPELRGRPVAVLPVLAETTCCIAASYEAKRLGVKTGTFVAEARKLCPDILRRGPAQRLCRNASPLVEAVESCLHVERVLSIDEVACRLGGSDRERDAPCPSAHQIKRSHRRTGRQRAAQFDRHRAQHLPRQGRLRHAEAGRPASSSRMRICRNAFTAWPAGSVRHRPGDGAAPAPPWHPHGARTVRRQQGRVARAWGSIEGERSLPAARGGDARPATQRGSVSHSHVLPPELRTPEAAYSVLHRLLQKAAMRLRSYGCIAGACR
jgi:DNA polymerase-4